MRVFMESLLMLEGMLSDLMRSFACLPARAGPPCSVRLMTQQYAIYMATFRF